MINCSLVYNLLPEAPNVRTLILSELSGEVARLFRQFAQLYPRRLHTIYNYCSMYRDFRKYDLPNLRIISCIPSVATIGCN